MHVGVHVCACASVLIVVGAFKGGLSFYPRER